MATSIDTFKKIMFDLESGGGVTYQYSMTNTDVSNTNICFLNFDLITNVQNQNVVFTVQHYSSLNGTLENTETFTLNYNNKTLNKNINLFTSYTLINIYYTSFNGILTGYIERLILGEQTNSNIGNSVTVRGDVDISGQRVITDISGQRVDISGQYLNVFVQNTTTTNLDNISGINLYQIRPKIYMLTLSGQTTNIATNMLLGGVSCTIDFNTQGYGLPNYRTWKAYIGNVVGATQKILTYDYVNSNGDLVENNSILVPVNSYTTLGTNILSINKWKVNNSLTTNDTLYLLIGSSNSILTSIGGATSIHNYTGMITIPNGCIGYVTSLAFYSSTTTHLILHKWDTSGVRVNTYTFYNASNLTAAAGYDGSFGGIFYPGETIAWSRLTASAESSIYSNVVIRSII